MDFIDDRSKILCANLLRLLNIFWELVSTDFG